MSESRFEHIGDNSNAREKLFASFGVSNEEELAKKLEEEEATLPPPEEFPARRPPAMAGAERKLRNDAGHDSAEAQYKPSGLLRELIEKQMEVKRGGSFAEAVGNTLREWTTALEEGNTRTVIDQLRRATPVFQEAIASKESRDEIGEAVALVKRNAEIYKLRAIVYGEILHDDEKARHYARLAERDQRELDSVGDLLKP